RVAALIGLGTRLADADGGAAGLGGDRLRGAAVVLECVEGGVGEGDAGDARAVGAAAHEVVLGPLQIGAAGAGALTAHGRAGVLGGVVPEDGVVDLEAGAARERGAEISGAAVGVVV